MHRWCSCGLQTSRLNVRHVSMNSENSGVLADVAEELQDHRCESEDMPQEQWSPGYLKQVDQRAPNCQHRRLW